MTELFLLARVAGQIAAIPASRVEAVVDIAGATPVPRTAPHVLGLTAVRSQIATLLDVGVILGEASSAPEGRAIVTVADGHRYALRIDAVDDVVSLGPPESVATMQLRAGWRDVTLGRLRVGDRFALLLDVARLVSPSLATSLEGTVAA